MEDLTIRLRLSGRVQVVGFRYFTKKTAQKIGISGWVRNESDGTVFIEAHGDSERIEKFVHSMEGGPPHAKVTSVQHETIEKSEINLNGFEIRY